MNKPNPNSLYQIACALKNEFPNAYSDLLSAAKEGQLPVKLVGGFTNRRFQSTLEDAREYLQSIQIDRPVYRTVLGIRVSEMDFRSHIEVLGEDDCWPWRGRKRNGYGFYGRLQKGAHRIALALAATPADDSLVAMHICDNPACCNPRHLRWGTVAENNADKVAKNRQARGKQCRKKNLTKCYKRLHDDGMSISEIARRLQVTRQAVRKALNRKSNPPPAPPLDAP